MPRRRRRATASQRSRPATLELVVTSPRPASQTQCRAGRHHRRAWLHGHVAGTQRHDDGDQDGETAAFDPPGLGMSRSRDLRSANGGHLPFATQQPRCDERYTYQRGQEQEHGGLHPTDRPCDAE